MTNNVMDIICKAYREGARVEVDIRLNFGYGRYRRVKGPIIREYKRFILVQTPNYKECIDKGALQRKEAELIDFKIIWERARAC